VDPGQHRDLRSARHAALGDPVRLAIVDELTTSDRAPVELQRVVAIPSNLLAHHLDVLEHVGLISRHRSSGDGRRRYLHLHRDALGELVPGERRPAQRALFVCTHNSARSQLAAALWTLLTNTAAESAGTHPADRVHPGAVAAGRRAGLDLTRARPTRLVDVWRRPPLAVTVCDRAHEELGTEETWLHWSIPDPVSNPTRATFDATVADLRSRIDALVNEP
jgi:ArsR family transcriptional regulator, arsenate/arsenite/antimonite-responsive transcriptional repressor / arsenate reductase (thioredoxin)